MNATGEKMLYALAGLVVGAASTYVVLDFLHEKELDDVYAELDGLRENAANEALEKYGKTGDNVTHIHNHVPPTGLPENETESGGAGDTVGARVLDTEGATHCTHDVPLNKPCEMCAEILSDDADAEHFVPSCAHGTPIDQDCPVCDGEVPVEDAHLVAAPWDADASIPTGPGGQPLDDEDIIAEEQREARELEAIAIAEAAAVEGLPFIVPDNKVTQPALIGQFNRDDGSFEINPKMSVDHPDIDAIVENDMLYPLIGEEAFGRLMDSIKEPPPEALRMVTVRNTVLHVDFVIQY